ncbi:MAG: hypothetical protein U0636_09455 [Phycisphaerales bacterium]
MNRWIPGALTLLFLSASGCATPQDGLGDASVEVRAHLEQESKFQELRQDLRTVARQISIDVPSACDRAFESVDDMETRSNLLAVAATSGTFACVRACAVDPRAGLADLTLSFATIEGFVSNWSRDPQYKGLNDLVNALHPVVTELWRLCDAWLPPEMQARLHEEVEAAISQEEARMRLSASGLILGGFRPPPLAAVQVRSSFMDFNDFGLLEYGLGEAHYLRLNTQELADTIALMPMSMEYHARRAVLWSTEQHALKEVRQRLDSAAAELQSLRELQELRTLRPLAELAESPWKIGVPVAIAITLGLALQGVLLARALRTRV